MAPNDDVILAWNPEALPAEWEAIRGRYFAFNWIRFLAILAAFGLFLGALIAV